MCTGGLLIHTLFCAMSVSEVVHGAAPISAMTVTDPPTSSNAKIARISPAKTVQMNCRSAPTPIARTRFVKIVSTHATENNMPTPRRTSHKISIFFFFSFFPHEIHTETLGPHRQCLAMGGKRPQGARPAPTTSSTRRFTDSTFFHLPQQPPPRPPLSSPYLLHTPRTSKTTLPLSAFCRSPTTPTTIPSNIFVSTSTFRRFTDSTIF
jgi:hypothetical protein